MIQWETNVYTPQTLYCPLYPFSIGLYSYTGSICLFCWHCACMYSFYQRVHIVMFTMWSLRLWYKWFSYKLIEVFDRSMNRSSEQVSEWASKWMSKSIKEQANEALTACRFLDSLIDGFRFPNDSWTFNISDQFLWGPALMISPVLDEV